MAPMHRLLPLLALVLLPQESPRDAARAAVAKTAGSSYRYRAGGRFERGGEFVPPALLTARIGKYRSARHGALLLVKGPDGLWKSPEERAGEKVENPEKDAADIVAALEEARPPHELLGELLAGVGAGSETEDVAMAARVLSLPFEEAKLREAVEERMKKAVERGTLEKPDEVRWATLKGQVRAWVDRRSGLVRRFRDEKSVKLAYKRKDAEDEVRVWKLEIDYELEGFGEAKADLPAEVKERLKLEE